MRTVFSDCIVTARERLRMVVWFAVALSASTSLLISCTAGPEPLEVALPAAAAEYEFSGVTPKLFKHTDYIRSAALSHDASRLAIGGQDGHIVLWNVQTNAETSRLEADGSLRSLSFSPDGQRLASGSREGAILWDLETGGRLLAWNGVWPMLAFLPDGRHVVMAGDHDLRMVGIEDGQTTRAFEMPSGDPDTAGNFRSVTISVDGRWLAVSQDPRSVRVWEIATGRHAYKLTLDGQPGTPAFSADGKLLATGSNHNDLQLWDVATGSERKRFDAGESIDTLAFTPDGKRVLTGGTKNVRLWDLSTGQFLSLRKAEVPIAAIVDPLGRYLVSAHWHTSEGVYVWEGRVKSPR